MPRRLAIAALALAGFVLSRQQWAQQNMSRVLGVLQQRLHDDGLIK